MKLSKLLFTFFILAVAIAAFSSVSAGQRRDYMTEQEVEIVRDAQDIDDRIEVVVKAIDRRFAALNIEVGGWKSAGKDSDKWGPAPKGTRLDLFSDIKKLLQKAIDDIDNLAAHPDAAPIRDKADRKAREEDAKRFPKAVRALAAAATRYTDPLKSALDIAKDEKEKGSILDSLDLCSQILEAVNKLP